MRTAKAYKHVKKRLDGIKPLSGKWIFALLSFPPLLAQVFEHFFIPLGKMKVTRKYSSHDLEFNAYINRI